MQRKEKLKKMVSIRTPQIQSNGLYEDSVMERIIQIVQEEFETYVASYYFTNPFEQSIFTSALEALLIDMKIDIKLVMPAIIKSMADHYYDKIIKILNEDVIDLDIAESTAKMVVVLFQETSLESSNRTKDQIFLFFEFIFRFGVNGARYNAAQQFIIDYMDFSDLNRIYEIVFKHIDPVKSVLPLMCFDKSRGLIEYSNFTRIIYGKLLEVQDSPQNSDLVAYSNNILTVLYNMEILHPSEDFNQEILELLQRADLKCLINRGVFIKTLKESKRCGSPLSIQLNALLPKLIADDFISQLSEEYNNLQNFRFAFVIENLNYLSYAGRLSFKCLSVLNYIINNYCDYKSKDRKFGIFQTLEEDFMNMTALELEGLRSDISELIPILPVSYDFRIVFTNAIFQNLLTCIPNLISASVRNTADPNLNIERYKTFVKLLEFATSTDYGNFSSEEVYPKVLFFYVANLNRVRLDDVHESLMKIFENLTKSNHFLCNMPQRKFVYEYLKAAVGPEKAVNVLNELFFKMLKVKINKPYAVHDSFGTAGFLRVSPNPAITSFFFAEIRNYILNSRHIGIEKYNNAMLPIMAWIFIKYDAFSKTELLIIEKVFQKYSSDNTFSII